MSENIKAIWSFSLDTECPKCGEDFDVNSAGENGTCYIEDVRLQVCEQDTYNSKNIEVECPNCKHEFIVDCEY